jgi:hypothetical protein
MQSWIHLAAMAVALSAIAATTVSAATPGDAPTGDDLTRLRSRTVFFGHQSVGMNLLDGVQLIASGSGTGIRIAEFRAGEAVPPGTVAHAWVGTNHDPASKIDAFARAVDSFPAPGVDIALVKLCYVDFTADTDAAALLARYRAGIEGLQRRHPGTTFVHVTAPVSTVEGGARALLKQAMGKPPYGLLENVRREEYNQLLRRTYEGKEPVFDLARLESTAPDGRVETVEWKGKRVPAMVPAYTDDGGHLNREGKILAARALVSLLASVPVPPKPDAPKPSAAAAP